MVEMEAFNYSQVISICGMAEYELIDDEQVFVRVHDIIIRQWQWCGMLFRASQRKRIVVQVVMGNVGKF
jgi:hypothetical protein